MANYCQTSDQSRSSELRMNSRRPKQIKTDLIEKVYDETHMSSYDFCGIDSAVSNE
jgi:hypothetical protein